jgi:propanol-preferring alcohol dehydrogenase
MRALLLSKPADIGASPLLAVDVPDPQPGPAEVLVRVRVCGICHTDLHAVEGELPAPKLPLIPGHQVIGRVEAVGGGVAPDQFRPGDRIGVAWLHWACGECSYCRSGRENLCPYARFTGYTADGGYAERLTVPAAFAYRLPEGGPSEEHLAPLLCGGVIGYRALRLSAVQRGGTLGLYGFGASAHIVLQIARYWGCTVYVFTRGKAHQDLALRLGAAWVGVAQDPAPTLLDAAIVFAPAGGLVPLALGALAPGGTLALAGITMTDIPAMPYSLLYRERTLRSVANATRRDAVETLRLAAEIPIETEIQVFPLAEANKALFLLKQGRVNGAGVLMAP